VGGARRGRGPAGRGSGGSRVRPGVTGGLGAGAVRAGARRDVPERGAGGGRDAGGESARGGRTTLGVGQFDVIVVIVASGVAEEALEAARRAGAEGATILHGRGSGIHEQKKIFNIPIEAEKEDRKSTRLKSSDVRRS